jgi:hypothetical protein
MSDLVSRLSHMAAVLRGPHGQEPLTSLDVETLECVAAARRELAEIERLRAALDRILHTHHLPLIHQCAREALRPAEELPDNRVQDDSRDHQAE